MGLVHNLLNDPRFEAIVKPERALRFLLMRSSASFATRLRWDAFDRPQYAYGIYQAAVEARMLGIGAISVAEIGVASGDGLVAMERIAAEVERVTAVEIAVYGFDTGTGMPPPTDNRDLPYAWNSGFYGMDEQALRARLSRAELVIGDVAQTAPAFAEQDRPPLGYAAVDVDYYSSTVATFPIFEADESRLLPRTFLHFDDVVGDDRELHSPFAGQLAAIADFNAAHEGRKLAKVHAFRHKRIIDAAWHDQLHVLHCFDHSRYADYVYSAERELPR
jgi:hypothetical protein